MCARSIRRRKEYEMSHRHRSHTLAQLGVLAGAVVAFGVSPAHADGPVVCWGSDFWGQCTPPAWLGKVRTIAGGRDFALAIRPNGSVIGWGNNTIGQLGAPSGLDRVVEIAAGESHAAALRADGQVVCWGGNRLGESTVPPNLPPIRSIAAGGYSSFALTRDLTVRQWGNIVDQGAVPTDLPAIAQIAAGQDHAMALSFSGLVRCWGYNSWGQTSTPANLPIVRAIAAGALHSVALTADRNVVCWGRADNGQLLVPSGLTNVVAIAGGGAHTAALREDGTVVCWGFDLYGQSSPPTQPVTRQVSLGLVHSMTVTCGVDIDLHVSPDLGSFGFGAGKSHTFSSLPSASNGGVTLEVIARGDLDLASEFLVVTLDGQAPGSVLFATAGSASDCPAEPSRAVIALTAAAYAALAADGQIQVHIEPSVGVSAAQCTQGSLVLELAVPKFSLDCNGNGVEDACDVRTRSDLFDCDQNGSIDSCEIASSPSLDCDQNGRLDWCEIAAGAQDKDADGRLDECEFARGDLNLDGEIGGADLAGVLALWGVSNAPYGDLNGDGVVGGPDLTFLLSRWGPVLY